MSLAGQRAGRREHQDNRQVPAHEHHQAQGGVVPGGVCR